jgi:hypothetical protein
MAESIEEDQEKINYEIRRSCIGQQRRHKYKENNKLPYHVFCGVADVVKALKL